MTDLLSTWCARTSGSSLQETLVPYWSPSVLPQWTFPGNKTTIHVQTARRSDAPTVLTIHRRVIEEGEWFLTRPDEFSGSLDGMASRISEYRRSPNSVFLVARVGRPIVGFLTVQGGYRRVQRHTAKLEVMIDVSARGRGIGRALMRAAIEWCEHNELLSKLGLNVFANNERAIALYQSLGFQKEGYRAKEFRMDDGTWRDELLLYRDVPLATKPSPQVTLTSP